MIKIIYGDLLKSDAEYICHQVNCQGVMGSGVAKQIKKEWPAVFNSYQALCNAKAADRSSLMGTVQTAKVDEAKAICNIFGQLYYGRDSQCYTDVLALKRAFEEIADNVSIGERIAMPYRIGCGLGGGDWGVVMDMLSDVFQYHSLTLYRL